MDQQKFQVADMSKHIHTLAILVLAFVSLTVLPMSALPAAAQGTGEDNLPRYWQVHAFLMTAGTILFVGTYAALWLKYISKIKGVQLPALAVKVSRMWYGLHVQLGMLGVTLLAIGTTWGYIMVDWAHNGQHLRLPHSYIGVVSGVIALVPLVIGVTVKWGKRRRVSLRWWHVALGISGIVIMLIGLSSGWALE